MQNTTTSTDSPTHHISYLWIIPLGLAWPVIALAMAASNNWPYYLLLLALYYLPMGLLSGGVLVFLLGRAASRVTRVTTVSGYLLASPIAYRISLIGGLLSLEGVAEGLISYGGDVPPFSWLLVIGPPLWVTIVSGVLPLLAGMLAGFALGGLWEALRGYRRAV